MRSLARLSRSASFTWCTRCAVKRFDPPLRETPMKGKKDDTGEGGEHVEKERAKND